MNCPEQGGARIGQTVLLAAHCSLCNYAYAELLREMYG